MSSQSASQGQPSASTAIKSNNFWKDIISCFQSIHLAVTLLVLLAITTIIGVVMPQEGMVELAEIKQRYGSNFGFLHTLGFFNVYTSFWFVTLEVLFFFSLLIGSFKWLKPATLAAVQKTFLSASLMSQKQEAHSLPFLVTGTGEQIQENLRSILKKFKYRVYQDGQGNLYACKGNITRLGPSIAHVGILICLISGLYSSFTGFKAVRMAIPGDTFSITEANTFKTNLPEPLWLGSVPSWEVQVKDFRVEFYEDHPETAKQYYSDLAIVSPEGKVLKEETIFVNHPLLYDNLSIYQASFAPTGRFHLNVNNQPVTVEINNQFNDRPVSITPLPNKHALIMFPFFAGQDPGVKENDAVFFVRSPNQDFESGKMPENIRLKQGQTGVLNGHAITYIKPEMSTGLQIKRAPEVPLMYLSYIIIAIGTTLCFFSQRQIWVTLREVAPGKSEVMLHPKTNKGKLSFRKELLKLQTAFHQTFSPSPPVKELPS